MAIYCYISLLILILKNTRMKVGLYTTLLAILVVGMLSHTHAHDELVGGDNINHLRKLDGHSVHDIHGLWEVMWGKIMECISYWKGEVGRDKILLNCVNMCISLSYV